MTDFEITVTVSLKKDISDPEGKNVKKALFLLGFSEVEDVKILKSYKIKLNAKSRKNAEERVKEMTEKLLANPIIHTYHISGEI
ncbi:MAG: phosphoribosylformylglycinamidine synthase subunit PurS [Candidatus Methanofastidiosia archaeon]